MIIPLDVVRAGWVFLCLIVCLCPSVSLAESRQPVKALYIPLADHYAALVAYEKYAADMQYADFSIQQMKSWDLLRGYFNSEDADMAFVMSPLASTGSAITFPSTANFMMSSKPFGSICNCL